MAKKNRVQLDQATFEALAENSLDAILITDMQVNFIYANPAAYKLFGCDPKKEDIVGTPGMRFWLEKDIPFLQQTVLPQAMAGGWAGEVQNRRADGTIIDVQASCFVIRDAQNQPVSVVASIRDITASKKIEATAHETLERLNTILNSMPIVLYTLDRQGIFTLSEGKGLASLGLKPGQVVGMSAFDVYKDFPIITESIERVLRGEAFAVEFSVGPITFENMFAPLHDAKGELVGAIGISSDITARKQAEATAHTMAERLNIVINNLPLVLFAIDQNGVYTLSEGKGLAATGHKPGELVGVSTLDAFRDFPDMLNSVRRALAGETLSVELSTGSTYYETTYVPLYDANGKQEGALGVSFDVTARKRSETETRRLAAVIETTTDLVVITDMQGKITYLNPAGLAMVGRTKEELPTLGMSNIHTPEVTKKIQEEYLPVVMQKGAHTWEAEMLRPDGTIIPVSEKVTFIMGQDGKPEGMVATVRDITASKRAAEEALRLQEQVIEAQRHALQELSTPIIPVLDRIIVMPLIGSIDSLRAKDITRALLAGISQYRAKIVIVDITGVPLVDSGVADHLNKTIQAARLKGAQTIITGMSDAVAEAIIDLGIDWSGIQTLSDLQTGLMVAINTLGLKLSR
jgi:rsbT co-antagonist protein RsbR